MRQVFLNAYGKHNKKVSTWIFPENWKNVFDSTVSTDDTSAFEPPKSRRTRVKPSTAVGLRKERLAKKKAMQCLAEKTFRQENKSDEENTNPLLRRTSRKKVSVAKGKSAPTKKRKATLSLTESSSNEEDITKPSLALAPQERAAKRPRFSYAGTCTRGKLRRGSLSIRSEKLEVTAGSSVNHPSAGRFVTLRGQAASRKLRQSRAKQILSSSDEFTTSSFRPTRNCRSSRKRKVAQMFGFSSAESSVNATGLSSFTNNLYPEISLNESADHIIGPCTRKPIFCSTPSAGNFHKQGLDKLATTPSSLATSTTFPDLISPQKVELIFRPSPDEKHSSKEQSRDLFTEPASLFEGTESNSMFISATQDFDLLLEALRDKCLNQSCTVSLPKLNQSQLHGQTTYSSCLEVNSKSNRSQKVVFVSSSEDPIPHDVPVVNNKIDHSANHRTDVSAGRMDIEAPIEEEPEESVFCEEKNTSEHTPASEKEFTVEHRSVKIKQCSVVLRRLPLKAGRNYDYRQYVDSASGSVGPRTSLDESHDNKSPKATSKPSEPPTNEGPKDTPQPSDSETAELISMLKKKCLKDTLIVKVKNLSPSELKEALRRKDDFKISSGDDVERNSRMALRAKKTSQAPKEKRKRSLSVDRTATGRKVYVSGMSTSRWKNNDAFKKKKVKTGDVKAEDDTIGDLMSKQELEGSTMNFFTPMRMSRLNLSSVLANLTPRTQTWSRLKAALSIHRKGAVRLTPRNFCQTPSSSRRTFNELSRDLFSSPHHSPLPRHLSSQLLSQCSEYTCEDPELSDAEKVYAECGQRRPIAWEECFPNDQMKKFVKIGEGTFGEVFSASKTSGPTTALKVIPVEGRVKVNGEDQKTFGEILHEIIISKELSSLKENPKNQTHGFIGLNDLHCVQGSYPSQFLEAWDVFDQQKVSENDRPDFYDENQLFIILEFEFGGVDLENSNGALTSLSVAKSILHQVTAALAVAEQELHFEHRDLHWGNVLVKTTKQKTGSFNLNGTAHSVETKGVLVRIIDYSLSRLEIDDLTVSCDISNDEELFMGQGDYQFDIYRLMRQENGNNWSDYCPHTNVLWLHYLCSKLMSMKYRGTGGRGIKKIREELACFHSSILKYTSATDALQNCPMFNEI